MSSSGKDIQITEIGVLYLSPNQREGDNRQASGGAVERQSCDPPVNRYS